MKSRIKQITLLDGKQLFYPNEEEILKLSKCIDSVITETEMTKEEYEVYLSGLEMDKATRNALISGIGITNIELKEYYSQNDDGEHPFKKDAPFDPIAQQVMIGKWDGKE